MTSNLANHFVEVGTQGATGSPPAKAQLEQLAVHSKVPDEVVLVRALGRVWEGHDGVEMPGIPFTWICAGPFWRLL